jgi:hypothetical protein
MTLVFNLLLFKKVSFLIFRGLMTIIVVFVIVEEKIDLNTVSIVEDVLENLIIIVHGLEHVWDKKINANFGYL